MTASTMIYESMFNHQDTYLEIEDRVEIPIPWEDKGIKCLGNVQVGGWGEGEGCQSFNLTDTESWKVHAYGI